VTAIFLHGVAGSRATYGWLPGSLGGHRVVRPDFRGHGAAERTPGSYLIADYTADVISVLRREGPAVLVGHSLGGVAAWSAAQRVPELVLGVFLEDPPLYVGESEGHAGNMAIPHFRDLRAKSREWQAQGVSEAEAASRLAAEPDADLQTPDALAARAYALLHLDPAVLDTVIDGSLLAGTDVVSPVDVPVCVLAAGSQPVFAVAHEARLAETHPDVEVVRLEGAGHSIHDERAFRSSYFERVEGFVGTAAGRGRATLSPRRGRRDASSAA
jgi:pimeloyl-ACP methyl ester carboxylesterase